MDIDTLLSARALMGLSLVFHTFFTPIAIGMPLMLFATEGLGLRTGNPVYRQLARTWTPIVGLLFAVGAVSGTVLSFEMGLLFPTFMDFSGGIFGMPFALEGFAFFTEAIFLGVYIYGWDRLSPRAHWLATIPLFLSAAISAVFVISANSWMNTPEGFELVNGEPTNIDPWDAMFNAAWPHELIHGTLASYVVTGFTVAGVYAFFWLRGRRSEATRTGLKVAMVMAAIAIPLQIIAGDFAARRVADLQPPKFAAMEGQFETETGAPLRIGGIPIDGETRFAIEIPKLLSFLTHRDFDAEITGLNDVPEENRPNEVITHLSFQVMVGIGFFLLALAIWYWIAWWRRRREEFHLNRWLGILLVASGPLSFVAIQAGWFVTEFGRQPWVIYEVMRTSEGATEEGGVRVFFWLFAILYVVISVALIWTLVKWPFGRRGGDVPEAALGPAGQEAADVA